MIQTRASLAALPLHNSFNIDGDTLRIEQADYSTKTTQTPTPHSPIPHLQWQTLFTFVVALLLRLGYTSASTQLGVFLILGFTILGPAFVLIWEGKIVYFSRAAGPFKEVRQRA